VSVTPLWEGAGIALGSLAAHKVRAALTILGVAIGVMVVMVIGALISGFDKGVSDVLERAGPKTFYVGRWWAAGVTVSDGSEESSPWRRNPPLTTDDARLLARLPSVRFVAVDENTLADIQFEGHGLGSVRVHGRSAAWPMVAGGDIAPGRSFTAVEDQATNTVVGVNQKLAEMLFGQRDPIGQRVKIQSVPFTVIGVFNPPPDLFGAGNNPEAFVPHETFAKYLDYWRGWMEFLVGPAATATTEQAMQDVTVALRLKRGLRPGQPDNFAVVSQDRFLESLSRTTLLFRIVMFALSSVALLVGGVGVVAIMMISVTERTREIGVRKALGATRREILWQFLVEAATLTLVGGAAGLVAGGLVAFVVARTTPLPAHVPVGSVIAALAAAALTGIVFGLYPANKAARLDPIEALRYE
jgi:putative ABC transport system permease protein